MATGTGLQFLGTLHGAPAHIGLYDLPATDTNVICKQDVVMLTTTGLNAAYFGIPANTIQCVTAFVSGHPPLGVVMGFLPDPTYLFVDNYRQASTHRMAHVCDDPDAIYAVQEDAVGGVVSAANIGEMINAKLVVGTPSTTMSTSTTMLDSSTVTTSGADVKIIGVYETPGNSGTQTGGAILKVMLYGQSLRIAASQA